MQKKIFEDQATMHEAFLAGGAEAIAELHGAHIVDSATLEGWRQIAAGRLEEGNRALLLREQRDIIDRFYVEMLDRRQPAGSVFTYLMTLTGAPSVPGGKGYPERYPLTLGAGPIRLRTPLADGNIAIFANRWKLIEEDTLPAYLAFVRDHPAEARSLMGTPVARRALPFRLLARAGLILRAAVTRWGPVAERTVKPLAAARADGVTVDLAAPPARRVWMNPGRRPFDLRVRLPDGREFRARPEFAVMLGDRLTAQLARGRPRGDGRRPGVLRHGVGHLARRDRRLAAGRRAAPRDRPRPQHPRLPRRRRRGARGLTPRPRAHVHARRPLQRGRAVTTPHFIAPAHARSPAAGPRGSRSR